MGRNKYCEKNQLLTESEPVENDEWIKYEFTIEPEMDINFITYEAFYESPTYFAYNGHVLIDESSNFIEVDCETK